LWWAIGSAESSSEHPLAKQLREVATVISHGVITKPTHFENNVGIGIVCTLLGIEVRVSSARHTFRGTENADYKGNLLQNLEDWASKKSSEGSTVVAVSIDGEPIAAVSLTDSLAPHARACVAELQLQGIEVWLCTGDHDGTAQAVAKQCGIDASQILSEALPADKVALVERLQQTKCHGEVGSEAPKPVVSMIGDGINDAPALAAAELGIAIGAGHDVTVDAADVILVRSDLRDLVSFLSLARCTLRTIWRNFLWAFLFNSLALPVAAGALWHYRILLTPPLAACLMLTSSLMVVFSSLSLRGFQPNKMSPVTAFESLSPSV
jgi:P-type E1-E2 ATPase